MSRRGRVRVEQSHKRIPMNLGGEVLPGLISFCNEKVDIYVGGALEDRSWTMFS